jgi:hypothetical protein
MKVTSHLDFGKSAQIIQVTLQKVSSLPSPGWAGGLVYLTTDNKIYWHNGTDWVAINDTSGLITSVTGSGGITVTTNAGVATVTFDPDGSTLELDGVGAAAKARIKDAGVTSIKIADKNITFAKIQDIPTMTVIGRITSGTGVSSAITVLTDLDVVIANHDSLATAKAVKDYVNERVGGLGSLQGGFNANTESQFPSGSKKGDYWYVTHSGTVQGVPFNIGDVIIANQANASPTNTGHWIFLETNRDQATTTVLGLVKLATQAEARAMTDTEKALTPKNLDDVKATNAETQTGTATDRFITPANLTSRTATETRTGIARIATQAEVTTGTDDTTIVTPAKLKVDLDTRFGAFGKYVANVGNGSATSITVTHSFNTLDVTAEVFENSTGQSVICDVTRTGVNAISVGFATAPTSNQFRVIIRK